MNTRKGMLLNIHGRKINCFVTAETKQSFILTPMGKKNLFRGCAKIILSKSNVNDYNEILDNPGTSAEEK